MGGEQTVFLFISFLFLQYIEEINILRHLLVFVGKTGEPMSSLFISAGGVVYI